MAHENVFFDGEIRPAREIRLAAQSDALFYGTGVFTTVAIRNGEPLLWDKHARRLAESSAKLGLDGFDAEAAAAGLKSLIESNGAVNGRTRITFFDGSAGPLWSNEAKLAPHLLINSADFRNTPHRPLITLSPYILNSRSPVAGLKTCNYLENILALRDCTARGYHEAIRLNENGAVASACMANVFWLAGGQIFTPALGTGCLAGTTREFILENLECVEVEADPDELRSADAIFLTSAGLGVAAAASLDGVELTMSEHEIMQVYPG